MLPSSPVNLMKSYLPILNTSSLIFLIFSIFFFFLSFFFLTLLKNCVTIESETHF